MPRDTIEPFDFPAGGLLGCDNAQIQWATCSSEFDSTVFR